MGNIYQKTIIAISTLILAGCATGNESYYKQEQSYRTAKGERKINAAPVSSVSVSKLADTKRDVMALSYVGNAKATPPKNTNIYQPLTNYIGGYGNDIISQLGEPTRERNDPRVKVWQYKYSYEGRNCWLDIYLYPKGKKYQSTYVELRGINMTESKRRSCFNRKYKVS